MPGGASCGSVRENLDAPLEVGAAVGRTAGGVGMAGAVFATGVSAVTVVATGADVGTIAVGVGAEQPISNAAIEKMHKVFSAENKYSSCR